MASFIVDVECYVMNGRPVEDNCRLIQREEDRKSSIIDMKKIAPNIHRLGSLTIQYKLIKQGSNTGPDLRYCVISHSLIFSRKKDLE